MIVREGVVPLSAVLIGGLALGYTGHFVFAAIALMAFVWLGWLYWSSRRKVPASPLGVLAPADGRVSRVESFRDPWLDRDVIRIELKLRPPGITVIHGPSEGKIKDLWTRHGPLGESQLTRSLDASPDCYALWVHTDEGAEVVMAVSSRWPVSRCRFNNAPGERVGQGHRLAFVYFATSLDLLVPVSADVGVEPGQRVRAVESVLAEIPRD